MGRFVALVLTAASLLAFLGCGTDYGTSRAAPGVPVVRVLLLENRDQVLLDGTGLLLVRAGGGSTQRVNFPPGQPIPISLTSAGWRFGNLSFPRGEINLVPADGGGVRVNRLAYRGQYRLVPTRAQQFDVVNDVDVEGYLKGVVARELLHNWHEEAYRAQAIAARTYALYESRSSGGGRAFDLYCDQRSQVYGGIAGESAIGSAAVDRTRGIVLAYGPRGQEHIFKAYFSSCCGGITQSAADAFGDPPIAPLSDQFIGPRCRQSPRFNWGPVVIARTELSRRMRAWGRQHNQPEAGMGDVARVDVQFINRFGRPVRFVVTDARGVRYSLNGEDFRQAFDTAATDGVTIPSSFFKPVNEPTSIRLIDGHGFGHGVGLCQWCAETEAAQGASHESIVTSAYPGAVLLRAY